MKIMELVRSTKQTKLMYWTEKELQGVDAMVFVHSRGTPIECEESGADLYWLRTLDDGRVQYINRFMEGWKSIQGIFYRPRQDNGGYFIRVNAKLLLEEINE